MCRLVSRKDGNEGLFTCVLLCKLMEIGRVKCFKLCSCHWAAEFRIIPERFPRKFWQSRWWVLEKKKKRKIKTTCMVCRRTIRTKHMMRSWKILKKCMVYSRRIQTKNIACSSFRENSGAFKKKNYTKLMVHSRKMYTKCMVEQFRQSPWHFLVFYKNSDKVQGDFYKKKNLHKVYGTS